MQKLLVMQLPNLEWQYDKIIQKALVAQIFAYQS